MNSKVSIIIPVYNVEPWIRKCIDSVLCQSYRNLEILLINDGSTDKSGIICDEYEVKDKRIKVIHNKNYGQSYSRNVGIKISSGNIIMFVDSDDYLSNENIIEKFEEIIRKDNCDLIYTSYCRFNDGSDEIVTEILPLNIKNEEISKLKSSSLLRTLIEDGSFHHAPYLKICNRDFIIKNNIYFKERFYHEDFEWSAKVFFYANKITIYDKSWYMRRMRENSTMTSQDEYIIAKKICDRLILSKELVNFFIENNEEKYSIIVKDIIRVYWESLMTISTLYKAENIKKCIEVCKRTNGILGYSNQSKHMVVRKVMNVIGIENTLGLLKFIRRSI